MKTLANGLDQIVSRQSTLKPQNHKGPRATPSDDSSKGSPSLGRSILPSRQAYIKAVADGQVLGQHPQRKIETF